MRVMFQLNGNPVEVDVEPRMHLADCLRDELRLTGTHLGCEHGVCGACTVIVDGAAVRSCLILAVQAEGSSVVTVEGLSTEEALTPLQTAFRKHHALQCGFCTPGMLTTAHALLTEEPDADADRIRSVLSGNLCRCTGYIAIVVFLRKHPGLTFGILGDEVVVMLSVGIFTTRLVNFINDELPGKLCLPDHPYCILFPAYRDGYRYPSQIFEAILDILTLPIILLVYRSRPPDGVVAWTWFTIYGITRSVAEIWREPGFTVLGLDGGQFVAVLQIFIGIGMIAYCYRRGTRTNERVPQAAA